ncbi:uncharacterized protein [Watersipora subatra]|uniref:uncharacterized protein n=1 Tax=Watersipora subatra TaxID=2589382 RepID=UPI00355C3BCC
MKASPVKSDPETDISRGGLYPTDIEVKVEPDNSSFNTDSNEEVAEVKTEPEFDGGADNLYPTDNEINLEPESCSFSTHHDKETEAKAEPSDSSINNDSDDEVAEMRIEPESDGGAANLYPTVPEHPEAESLKPFERLQEHEMHNMVCKDRGSHVPTDHWYFGHTQDLQEQTGDHYQPAYTT